MIFLQKNQIFTIKLIKYYIFFNKNVQIAQEKRKNEKNVEFRILRTSRKLHII